ncbi:hypothetical protein G7077_08820 [Sphingomonas piscis]|uniref:Peptidase M15A C-terminal domain-containing protein n=1 Tax=Sphingomonas piscis TaxID=2714943 RepID=A0A6G7YQH5_9SPHN|nr:hypothetical protein [Sphingomonas piscis]QIK78984.1 hypothetical protein G7077_08820 [Sphingomonas piscis]
MLSSLALLAQLTSGSPPTPAPVPVPVPTVWNPAASYVTAGQDEPGYRSWYLALPDRRVQVTGFNQYLVSHGVGGVIPTWQLLRTASQWHNCAAQPYELPPATAWPNMVQTLRYIRDYVVPSVGPVEAVSVYRNPLLNTCAGGVPGSAHQQYYAVDLVPLRPTTREQLMATLCAVHLRSGNPYQVGLGFYAFLRFHVDSMRYRKWGMSEAPDGSPCRVPVASPPPKGIDMPRKK